MLLKSNGYFLLELLLSLSAFLMIGLVFVPLLSDIVSHSRQLEVEKKITQLLYQELHANLYNNTYDMRYSVTENGLVFRIYWIETSDPDKKEVCVSFDGTHSIKETVVCRQQE
jgi:competence protein ComGE